MKTTDIAIILAALGVFALMVGGGMFAVNMGAVQSQREYFNAGGGVMIPDDFTGIFRASAANRKRAKTRHTGMLVMMGGGGLLLTGGLIHYGERNKTKS